MFNMDVFMMMRQHFSQWHKWWEINTNCPNR